MMRELSWGVWAIRFVISMVGAAVLSFGVADYVVRAHNTSTVETMRALQGSIDRLNESVIANSGRLDAFTSNMTTLMERSATTTTEIVALRGDVARVQSAVQDAGIDIRIGSDPVGKQLDWTELKAFYGFDMGTPMFIQIPSSTD